MHTACTTTHGTARARAHESARVTQCPPKHGEQAGGGGWKAGWLDEHNVPRSDSIAWGERRGHYNKGTAALPRALPTAWASRAAPSRPAASPAAGKCHVTHERHGGRDATGWENHRTACVRGVSECLRLVAVECASVCWHVCARADASATRAVLWWQLLLSRLLGHSAADARWASESSAPGAPRRALRACRPAHHVRAPLHRQAQLACRQGRLDPRRSGRSRNGSAAPSI